ncbi:Uncharacterized protein TCM_014435 [Theobroma cacao]|uniref:Uncharacterized protein n=1 Tax=Theobroma cacao TaxID=3641 RepID=A0A061FXI0_THECC|nr:Uncharacterized protein TCM_014435 [Theobroma cacao]
MASWAWVLWPKNNLLTLDIVREPRAAMLLDKPKKTDKWNWREVGIGGVLKDDNDTVRIVFSKCIKAVNANLAKELVFREAMTIWAPFS